MGKNRKRILVVISCLFVFVVAMFLYPRKDDNKSIIKKSYAFNIKNDGETNYTSVDNLPSDLTNYHIDEEKTICENGGKVSIVGNKLAYQTLGSDRCSVYLYYEELHDIKINVSNPDYLLGGYTKEITNCANASWDYKLNGIVIDSINGNTKCDLSLTQKTSNNEELLTTIVNNKATRNENGKRYQGKNPDNYVWFNDELWRIIGNVPVCLESGCSTTENRVKIIRNYSIGAIKFSYSSRLGWMESNTQKLLNTCYLGKTVSCDDYCYLNNINLYVKGTCDYSAIGVDASDFYGKMVEDVYFNIGVGDTMSTDYYTREVSDHTTTPTKIGLMYASDFNYAAEEDSINKNWLYSIQRECTMTAYNSTYVAIIKGGYIGNGQMSNFFSVRPILYLKSNVYVVSGTGTKVDPYTLGMQ